MLNMVSLLPHCKKDSKVEAKSSKGATLNELVELKGSSSCLFFEVNLVLCLSMNLASALCYQNLIKFVPFKCVECITQS